jgi:DNA-binding XRE family transcriptional regulator
MSTQPMTTRALVAGRLVDVNRARTTTETVRHTVKRLRAFYDIPTEEIAKAIGVSRATWFTRLSGKTDFTIGECAVLADLFACSLDDLMNGRIQLNTPDPGASNQCTSARYPCAVLDEQQLADVIPLRPSGSYSFPRSA